MSWRFTVADKLAAVERELALRRAVYKRKVSDGSMTPHDAQREIALMEAIAEDYRRQIDGA